jgi:hypothetical protein
MVLSTGRTDARATSTVTGFVSGFFSSEAELAAVSLLFPHPASRRSAAHRKRK